MSQSSSLGAEAYEVWAPPEATWSPWVKPVLFAQEMGPMFTAPPAWPGHDVSWAPKASEGAAIVVDLPGVESVAVGIALAEAGYRPVPLFNGCHAFGAVVNTGTTVQVLAAATDVLRQVSLPADAPPAFLLDANRTAGGIKSVSPGKFDNRWITFPQDFPSANFLLSRGIRRVVLRQAREGGPQEDLAHVLLRWQEAGLPIELGAAGPSGTPSPMPLRPLQISRPSRFRSVWYRALALAGLRRHSGGGFGAIVPMPSSSG